MSRKPDGNGAKRKGDFRTGGWIFAKRHPPVPAAPNEPLTVSMMSMIAGRRSVAGCYSGTAKDSQDTLEFSALTDVHPMIEKYSLSKVAEAYEQMHSGKVRFRVVLTMER